MVHRALAHTGARVICAVGGQQHSVLTRSCRCSAAHRAPAPRPPRWRALRPRAPWSRCRRASGKVMRVR